MPLSERPLPRGEWTAIADFVKENNGGLRQLANKFQGYPQQAVVSSFIAAYRPRRWYFLYLM